MTRDKSVDSIHFFVCVSEPSEEFFECLASLSAQETRDDNLLGSVNVIWNCPEEVMENSRYALNQWAKTLSVFPTLHHYFEAQKGIPYARNRALQVARERGLQWVAFIDDDCVAVPSLAQTFADVAGESGALAVAGGWEIVSASTPSSWLPDAVFGVKHYQVDGEDAPNGAALATAYTRNVLLNLSEIDQLLGSSFFDTSLATTGGSDATYFFGVFRAGGRIVYAPDARVTETYSGKRVNLLWHFRRRIRVTQQKIIRARGTGEKFVSPGLLGLALLRLVWRLPLSVLVFPLAVLSYRIRRWIGSTVLIGSPLIAALLLALGVRFHEYGQSRRWTMQWRNAQRPTVKSGGG
jgi:glycosyltransferase involved in cell wall biosynthesis